MNGFYHLGELETKTVERIVARALALRRGAAPRRFPGRSLALLFFNPSLRTQASMQRAAARLGLELVQLSGSGAGSSGSAGGLWGIETEDGAVMDGSSAEHVREAAAVLGRFVDALAVRAFPLGQSLERDLADPLVGGFRRFAAVPVINLESSRWHPCQALADWATLEMLRVPRRARLVLTWAWHPKALPHAVPNSTLCMAAQRGMEVVVLRPEGYDLHEGAVSEARRLAALSGGSVDFTSDRAGALRGARVVYAKSWGSLDAWGDAEAEQRRRAPLRSWCVDESWMARTDGARFLHCLPVRRNVVVADEVLDGPRSAVVDQAENRLHAQTALLEELYAALERPSAPSPSLKPALEV